MARTASMTTAGGSPGGTRPSGGTRVPAATPPRGVVVGGRAGPGGRERRGEGGQPLGRFAHGRVAVVLVDRVLPEVDLARPDQAGAGRRRVPRLGLARPGINRLGAV